MVMISISMRARLQPPEPAIEQPFCGLLRKHTGLSPATGKGSSMFCFCRLPQCCRHARIVAPDQNLSASPPVRIESEAITTSLSP